MRTACGRKSEVRTALRKRVQQARTPPQSVKCVLRVHWHCRAASLLPHFHTMASCVCVCVCDWGWNMKFYQLSLLWYFSRINFSLPTGIKWFRMNTYKPTHHQIKENYPMPTVRAQLNSTPGAYVPSCPFGVVFLLFVYTKPPRLPRHLPMHFSRRTSIPITGGVALVLRVDI